MERRKSKRQDTDCYFFVYGSCEKGNECPYRHCIESLGNEKVCRFWKRGWCGKVGCKYRHLETVSEKDRTKIPCYHEDDVLGCRKPHCVFLHKKERVHIIETLKSCPAKLIMPVVLNTPALHKEKDTSIISLKKSYAFLNTALPKPLLPTPVAESGPSNGIPKKRTTVVDSLKKAKTQDVNVAPPLCVRCHSQTRQEKNRFVYQSPEFLASKSRAKSDPDLAVGIKKMGLQ